jgi:hypothetical protein
MAGKSRWRMTALAIVGVSFGIGYALVNIQLPGPAKSFGELLLWDAAR